MSFNNAVFIEMIVIHIVSTTLLFMYIGVIYKNLLHEGGGRFHVPSDPQLR